jgi:hypothetical protein
MTFVFLHIAKDAKIKDPISQTFVKSINTFYSDSEIIQISDNKTPKLDMVTRVFRFDGDVNKIMEFRIKANRELGLQKSAIYLDSDMIITNKFDITKMLNFSKTILLKRSFDLNLKFNINIKNQNFNEYNNYTVNEVFPIIACFIKSNSWKFWQEMSDHLNTLEKKFLYWYGDQEILKKLYFKNQNKYHLIHENNFACPPNYIKKKFFPYIVHFKGIKNKEIFKNQITLINDYLEVVAKEK